ncbi:MAG TPA: hypothetical protein VFJ58_12575 [Armatimonadota bacterium]|nr:hypothetical protein [Armatimonadota bacterium]
MEKISSRMAQFLEHFERSRTAGADAAGLYAETFLAGGPDGARCIRAEDFARALPLRKQMFERAGCRRTELAGVVETPLDERYSLARTKWRMGFERAGRPEEVVEVESTFLVDFGGEAPRILAYLSHQDALKQAAQGCVGTDQ